MWPTGLQKTLVNTTVAHWLPARGLTAVSHCGQDPACLVIFLTEKTLEKGKV